ncbi:ribonuclease H-like domain-containing protein, partial [Tanacetum coccineum]
MPPKPDLSFSGLEDFTSEPIFIKPVVGNSEAKASEAKPKAFRKNNGAPIIEDWVLDSEEDYVPQAKIEKKTFKPSFTEIEFVKPKQQEKTARKTVNHVEHNRQNTHIPRGNQRNCNNMMYQRLGSNFKMFNKACYVCGSFNHLQNFAKKTHPCPKNNMVPREVLMKSGLVSVNTARQVNVAHSKTTVNAAIPKSHFSKPAHSTIKRPIHKNTAFKNSNFNQRVNTVKDKNVNTVRPKAVVNAARPKAVLNAVKGNQVNAVKASACWVWKPKTKVLDHVSKHNSASITLKKFDYGNPQMDLQDQGVIDSGCSRHMTGNMSYLTDFEEIDGGYVAFGGNPKGGKITGRVPRKNNMYSVDLKNVVPKGGLTCLFAKATSDESKLWHRRLGHINFKTMNKLVKGNLVRGLPSKLFEINQTCVACQKGKQHRASYQRVKVIRTMLTNSKLPTTFWAEAVNTACYVQSRVLVTKPHNKTPYELFLGRKPTLGFMRPFGCPVTILNTIDHLGKFDGKADEGFFIRYSINSKAFRVFNSRTRIVEENLHVQFSENTPNIAGSGPNWLFDIDALTKSMNYKLVVAGNQSNGNEGTKACDDAGKARMEIVHGKDYIMLPLWTADPPFSQSSKSSHDARFKPLGDDEKKVTKEPGKEGGDPSKEDERDDQEKNASANNTNNVNAASTNEVNDIGRKASIELPDDPNMLALEDIIYSDDDEDVGADADMNNLDAFMPVSPIPTIRVHKDHPVEQIIRELNSAPKTRRMTKNLEEHEGIDYDEVFAPVARIEAIRLFLAYASFKDFMVYQMDVKSAFLYGKIKEEVYVCQPPGFEDPDFPDRVYKVEKALYGLHQAPRAWYETLSTYLLDNGFQRGKIDKTLFIRRNKGLQVKQKEDGIFISQNKYMTEILKKFSFTDVKTASTPMETQKSLLKDKDGEEVDVHLYRSMIGSLMYLTSSRPDIMFAVYSPFDLVAYTDSDYARASLDRKSIIG